MYAFIQIVQRHLLSNVFVCLGWALLEWISFYLFLLRCCSSSNYFALSFIDHTEAATQPYAIHMKATVHFRLDSLLLHTTDMTIKFHRYFMCHFETMNPTEYSQYQNYDKQKRRKNKNNYELNLETHTHTHTNAPNVYIQSQIHNLCCQTSGWFLFFRGWLSRR